ncbi:hypothetical protein [Paenibacillus abyssi]|uniref:Glycosyl hydrolase family 32 N-terminal domain-containing protein n=1 Tax=Paenibacillus abyssi TaxID=1340531 RepID=A0A917FRQ4_9BACL|nr:hypothetical protein [Paenibacillus abyssi]GGG00088.1 hypothetical protein GCM10010916_16640 [Paenibacillus abyssi]
MNIEPYLTPYKYGKPVLIGSGEKGSFDERCVDCPFVFQHNEKFYMMYVGFDGVGYQTGLATSENLLDWEPIGTILRRNEGSGWDDKNIAGTWIMKENHIDAPPVLKKWDNKYWLVYHAYPENGYEEGSAKIGLAWTEDENLLEWHRLSEPILTPEAGDWWEKGGLYKECLVEHGGTFYLYYNAKNTNEGRWIEQTGLATSKDLQKWERYSNNPVLRVSENRWDLGFVSDPCVLYDTDRYQWVMYFFGYDYKKAQEGIALSKDLLHWEKYPDPIIEIGKEGEIDSIFAHKPSVISHNGVLYHFYCSSRRHKEGDPTVNFGNEFRTITVAASEDIFS